MNETPQVDKFKGLARELECDEDEAKFEEFVSLYVITSTLAPRRSAPAGWLKRRYVAPTCDLHRILPIAGSWVSAHAAHPDACSFDRCLPTHAQCRLHGRELLELAFA